ncbi:MAG: tetratricopeptide repeat protein [Alphaproteobacteria bacterium]|nr:tetratricopeptide repeat protein [Alphaproteobacteria bacterium]
MVKEKRQEQELDFTDVFFKEVSEDVQNDNIKAFWKKYGTQIVVFVALCLTIAVSFETIKHWRDVRNQEYSNNFALAQSLYNQGKVEDSLKLLQSLSKDGNAIYSDIAESKIISVLFEQNKIDEALAKLETFIKKAHNDKLKNAAIMKLALYKLGNLSFDDMKQLLHPLIQEKPSAWSTGAKELLALSALRANNQDQALVLYNDIAKTPDVHETLRARAQNMISILTSTGDTK